VHLRAIDAGLNLTAELAEDMPMLNADPGKVKQMLLNLLSNAIKFTPAGGEVKVTAAATDGELVLEVADTGIGIAAADIPTALAPFGQIDSAFSRKTQGTGLGLPLVKTFIELHDGRLVLESQLGEGTTVSLYFPRQRVLAVFGVVSS
jgi:two-component system cell cycle sensor histidine kinase PleC